jgi:hypothetical protein
MQQKLVWRTVSPTDVGTTDLEGIGNVRGWEGKAGTQMFRWVKNPTTNVSFAQGDLACHKVGQDTIAGAASDWSGTLTDGSRAENYIYKPASGDLMYLAGVVMTTISSFTGTNPACYGWVQCLGFNLTCHVIALTGTAITAGAYLKAGNGVTYGNFDAMTQPSYKRTIVLVDAIASATTAVTHVGCIIQCI